MAKRRFGSPHRDRIVTGYVVIVATCLNPGGKTPEATRQIGCLSSARWLRLRSFMVGAAMFALCWWQSWHASIASKSRLTFVIEWQCRRDSTW